MTLGKLLALDEFLEKVNQLEWFGTSTNSSPSSLFKLGNKQIVIYDSSWIKMTLKENWVSRIVLTTKLIFCMFYENILISLIIMTCYYS